MRFAEVLALAQFEYQMRSKPKYDWTNLSANEQKEAIEREYLEWQKAFEAGDVDGEHGERNELLHLIVTSARRIMEITKEDKTP